MEHILLVDDNIADLKQAAKLLKEYYRVSMVKSGQQALEFLEKFVPALILMDVDMPELDGIETVRRIRASERNSRIPVIFFSDQYQAEKEVEGFENGGVDFLTKPFVREILLHRVALHLELYQYQMGLEQVVEERTKVMIRNMEQTERLQIELDVAARIQTSMLPETFPKDGPVEIYAKTEPAKEVGGDFYDYYLLDQNHFAFCIGDVSGKGVPAALFMVRTKTILNTIATSRRKGTAQILTELNRKLCHGNSEGMFVTLYFGILDMETGEVFFTNAGHNPPLLKTANGEYRYLESEPDFVLAGMEQMGYAEHGFTMKPGDSLCLYTDGITEAQNQAEELYGEDRLKDFLNKADRNHISREQLVDQMETELSVFSQGEQTDDQTMIFLTYKGSRN